LERARFVVFTRFFMVLCLAAGLLGYSGTSKDGLQERIQRQARVMRTLVVSSVSPSEITLVRGGEGVSVTITGTLLNYAKSVHVVSDGNVITQVKATLSPTWPSPSTVTFTAQSDCPAGDKYQLQLLGVATNSMWTIGLDKLRIKVSPLQSQVRKTTAQMKVTIEKSQTTTGQVAPKYNAIKNPPAKLGPAPDLIVTGCRFDPPNPTTDNEVNIRVDFKNQGDAAAVFPAGAAEWMAKTSQGVEAGGGGISVGGRTVPAGGTFFGGINNFVAPGKVAPGTYTVTVTVDSDNRVGESDETNNSAEYTLVISPGTGNLELPDLVITQMRLEPELQVTSGTAGVAAKPGTKVVATKEAQVAQPVKKTMQSSILKTSIEKTYITDTQSPFRVIVTVKNQGEKAAIFQGSAGSCRILGGPDLQYQYTPSAYYTIGPNETQEYQLAKFNVSVGTFVWKVIVDPDGRIRESDETNNEGTIRVEVREPQK
jgi:hypothetical protein